MTLLHGLCLGLLAPPLAATAYYWVLAAVALLRRPNDSIPDVPQVRFTVVIPAHDEEPGIAATLRSCRDLDYPADLFRVVVIADNCTDGTAAVARRQGADVLE